MKRNLLFVVLAITGLPLWLSSCQKAPELTLTSSSNIEFSADGSLGSITFTANRDWTVRAYDSWVSVSPSSGTASDGPVTVTLRCNANTTYEDRSTTVTIKMGDLSQTVTVKQPANKGIVLPKQVFDLQSDTRSIDVEVQANVQYSVSSSVDWIRQTGTKALTSKTLTFSIQENKTYDSREGKITIKPNEGNVQEQVITVRQAQKDALIVEKTSYDMPYGGGQIEIKVEANVAFDVTPNVDWLHHTETKALSSSTVCIKVDENPTYSNREGKIEIAQRNGSIKHIITVKQAGRIAVSSVELSQTSLKMKEGEMVTLVATVKPDNATDKTVTWSSSNENIARVDQSGRVTAVKEGAATITAKAGEMSAKCAVTVYKDIPVTSIVLNKTSLSLVAGETTSLVATVKPDDATDKTVTWSSYDTSIATVNSEGKVTAVGKGSTTITASAGNYSSSCKVFVKAASYPTPYGATDLGLSVIWGEKNLGATSAYDAGGYYLWGDPTGTGVIAFFDTPNTNYICDTQYDIARKQLGKGWRLPTREEIKELLSSCSWETVSNGVRLTGPNGNSVILPLTGMAYPADGAVGSISISSKDKGYMMTGESYADSYGRFAYVYHYNQSFSYNWSSYNAPMAKFPVRPIYEMLEDYVPVSSVTLNITSLSLSEGESETLVATVTPDDAMDKTVTWSSSNTAIATVDANGKVTAVKEGSATITAKAGEKSATCTVTVSKKIIAVTSISLNKTSLALKEGESETLVATVKPDDATDKTVTWWSSDINVALVDMHGKVIAQKEGSATIEARIGAISATCALSVAASIPEGNIIFADQNLKALVVATCDTNGDGELSYSEAAAVTSIEEVFKSGSYAYNLTSFNEFRYFTSVKTIPDYAFNKWKLLKSIILPSSIKSVGKYAFSECATLSYISIPSGLETVGAYAFNECGSLSSITLPDSVTSIGSGAFAGTAISSFSFPENIKIISDFCFLKCKQLTSFWIPSGFKSIGKGAFYGSGITSIVIPASITSIGNNAFSATPIKSITLPDGIARIGTGTFEGCKSLESVYIPDNVSSIDQDAFSGCSALSSIVLPNSVQYVGIYAFYGCSALSTLTVPTKLTKLDAYAFNSCTGLKEIICKSTTPPSIGAEIFKNTNECPIKVPASSVDDYKTATSWIPYSNRIVAITE